MGYAIKMHWKELFIFKWLSNCQKLFLFLKNWPFLEFSDSYQSEFVVKEFNLGNSEQFWATFVKNGSEFLQIFENRSGDVQNRWFWIFSWRIQIGKNLKIPKMVKFLKIKQFLAIWQPFENEQFFSMHFYSITHMKVGNPFIFIKLL